MAEHEALVKIKSSAETFCNVLGPDGKTHTLKLSDAVQKFHDGGLEEGAEYNIEYNDDTGTIFMAKKVSPATPSKKVNSSYPLENKSDEICALACLKACSNIAESKEELMELTAEMYSWIKSERYKQ